MIKNKKIKLKKEDMVKILTGKDKGKMGKIMKIFPRQEKAIIENLNLRKKHRRPKRAGEKGEVVEIPNPIHISNLNLVCPHCRSVTKVGFRFEQGRKARICKKCQNVI